MTDLTFLDGTDIPEPASDLSRLYYEAHITIEPLTVEDTHWVDDLCLTFEFRRSTFEMHKEKVPNAFISARDPSFRSMVERVTEMVTQLQEGGLRVLRYKIEDTLLDSNRGDVLPGATLLVKPV